MTMLIRMSFILITAVAISAGLINMSTLYKLGVIDMSVPKQFETLVSARPRYRVCAQRVVDVANKRTALELGAEAGFKQPDQARIYQNLKPRVVNSITAKAKVKRVNVV